MQKFRVEGNGVRSEISYRGGIRYTVVFPNVFGEMNPRFAETISFIKKQAEHFSGFRYLDINAEIKWAPPVMKIELIGIFAPETNSRFKRFVETIALETDRHLGLKRLEMLRTSDISEDRASAE